MTNASLNIAELRAKLAASGGDATWRSLEELADAPEFREAVAREFPAASLEWKDGVGRREFLQLMAGSLALAGLHGCSDRPTEPIVPYVNPPASVTPGKPLYFATAMPFDRFGRGIIVTSREGRPIKIEGNPDHPASLGGTDVFMQASILTLYDPARSQTVTHAGNNTSWSAFNDALTTRLQEARKAGGQGVRILSAPVISPTLNRQKAEFLAMFPQARWHQFSPMSHANTAAGAKLAFGRNVSTVHRFDRARTIVSLDSDFLTDESLSLRYARHFMDGRRVRQDRMEMSRLYVFESTLTSTGSMADHRFAMRPSRIATVAQAMLARLQGREAVAGEIDPRLLDGMVADLRRDAGACIVIAGEYQPPAVHAAVHAINALLKSPGNTVEYIEPIEPDPLNVSDSLPQLVRDMRDGVQTLLILGENPAFTAPADLGFSDVLTEFSNRRRPDGSYENLTAHLGLFEDQTSFCCQWHLPQAHFLESWSDIRAFDGMASIIQPLIAPLYGGRSVHEIVQTVLGQPDLSAYERVRNFWRSEQPEADFERWWQTALAMGVIAKTAAAAVPVSARTDIDAIVAAPSASTLELVIRPDPNVWDGSFASNAWLQELPRPFTKLVWGNAALISPKLAERQKLNDGAVVRIESHGRSIEAPVMIVPGLPDHAITVHLGYGKAHGFDAYRIRTSHAPWFSADARMTPTDRRVALITTRSHHAMDTGAEAAHRRIVRTIALDQFRANPQAIKEAGPKRPLLSLYPGWDYSTGYQWGMSIDMTACMGCNACVVACQAENNIPVVGKEEVARQREMHWIRIDSYFNGGLDDPKVVHQPVTCMHCENAPCEYVCPTGATTHSTEGLNQMTYNRCVGTRYCSNNCPYKVRRFNFFSYADTETTAQRILQRNPEVTVRSNGVMEKCTYCVQRIQNTRIDIEKMLVDLSEKARTAGDEKQREAILARSRQAELEMLEGLQTACQQACPTRAIVFGDINRPQSMVARAKAEPHDYGLLEELTTKPRTTYLARVSNPNPAVNAEGVG